MGLEDKEFKVINVRKRKMKLCKFSNTQMEKFKEDIKPENNKDLIEYLKRADNWIRNAKNPYRNANLVYQILSS